MHLITFHPHHQREINIKEERHTTKAATCTLIPSFHGSSSSRTRRMKRASSSSKSRQTTRPHSETNREECWPVFLKGYHSDPNSKKTGSSRSGFPIEAAAVMHPRAVGIVCKEAAAAGVFDHGRPLCGCFVSK
ncbi:hypothetical protein AVEN_55345-1 [Araneus ventricosus]|uniref:Uncharacterized protein n=1 Tax=Araneus ventricosus TaxID=182803 RepID=A0A4Y2DC50_ARAVE|nr:hypothetical protein AVEN_55345-1 [Araneus ventricosus]